MKTTYSRCKLLYYITIMWSHL